MSQIVVRVEDAVTVPGRGAVIAAVEVLSGELVVGCRLTDPQHAATWEVTGFGHGPPPARQDQHLLDINLKLVGGQQGLTKGVLLSEQPHPVS
jgi:hypothetical protein